MKNSTKDKRNPINVIIGRNLQYFMESNDIPIEEMAKSFGIEQDSLRRILKGINGISSEYCYILSEKYNCDMNFLFGGVERTGDLSNVRTKVDKSETLGKSMARSLHYLADIIEMKQS